MGEEQRLCRCNITDLLYQRQHERYVTRATVANSKKECTPDHAPTLKSKLSITNSIGLSGKKTPTKKVDKDNDKPIVSDFNIVSREVPRIESSIRECSSDTNLFRFSHQQVLTPVYPQQQCYQQYTTVTMKCNRNPAPSYTSAHANISCFTAGTASTITQVALDHPKNSSTMLFTNYFNKEHEDHPVPLLILDSSARESTESSQPSRVSGVQADPRQEAIRLREVQSEYAQSAMGDTSRKMVQKGSKFVSKLQKYISQPSKAIESLIVKDPKLSTNQNRSPACQPTGLSKAARFAKSVFGQHSQKLRH